MKPRLLLALLALSILPANDRAELPLRISVYATAGGVNRYLATPADRTKTADTLRRFQVSHIFLEGRRGDEYVPPALLKEIRDDLAARGFQLSGGIATVPGKSFGVRQNEGLSWLNFQAKKTQDDLANFFRENAPIFEEIIVDDFYCSGDTSSESDRARGGRSWGEYRRDLLVSLIEPMIRKPARDARPDARLVIKYPQWYDRFHVFGYDPPRMSAKFEKVWVGTEVRNPRTRRMGFVQPTEGYINFRWLTAIAGSKVEGAWFDHIECTAQNFADQAWQSVLAGARELTLFHLGDLVEGHPGHELFLRDLPELTKLAGEIRGSSPGGIAFYKPASGDSSGNMYLMDYSAMLGLPVVPAAQYPEGAKVVVLGVQAAADPKILNRVRAHLDRGSTIAVTPEFLRKTDPSILRLASVSVTQEAVPETAGLARAGKREMTLTAPLEVDAGLAAEKATVVLSVSVGERSIPLLTSHAAGHGRLLVWNIRTFTERDFRDTGERLLAPKQLGWPEIPQALADELRKPLLAVLGIRLEAPARVAFYLLSGRRYLFNFRDEPVTVRVDGASLEISPNRLQRR